LKIDKLDHLVLTVKDIEKTVNFYTRVLGMSKTVFGQGRIALRFADQKINLHVYGNEFDPKAKRPTPGSTDLCFITSDKIEAVIEHIESCDVKVIEGPVERTGAKTKLRSIYLRDPDDNLIELANEI